MPPTAAETAICPRPDCERRFGEMERRIDAIDGDRQAMHDTLTDIRVRLAGLEGRIAGYLVAASLLGTVVAFLAAWLMQTSQK